ncbi:chemotaxis protein [Proteobacteria bacterium 005FR1]|nr:chemotaxis protein [Proteobacteria bacterium 005FR1]
MKIESKNIFTSMKENSLMTLLVVMLVLSLAAMAGSIFLVQRDSSRDQSYLQLVGDLRVQSYQLTTLARDATNGSAEAFGQLQQVVADMGRTWDRLRAADPATRTAVSSELARYDSVWQRVQGNATNIVDNQETITFLHDVATTLNQSLPELQAEYENIKDILLENDAPADQVAAAQEQTWRAERIGRNVDKMLAGGEDSNIAADQFNVDANLFGRFIVGMMEGDAAMNISRITDPDARQSLQEVADLFEFVSTSVRDIFEASPALFGARQATNALLDDSPVLLETLGGLSDQISALSSIRQPNNVTVIALGIAAVVFLAIIGLLAYSGTRRRLRETGNTNERNQNAILRLLDELADLADGDLTTTATVTEDFTGAIADSINYTIDQLRILVSRINETAVNVSRASQDTQQTALHLAEASEHQAQEIAGASAAVNEMAVTIDQVSANAAESAAVAERSVSIAHNGAKVVQNTIHGMDTIREQIQDTSKRIKRLGESSQEIGDIVSLINDIADQTNILALNAAIQASMAGDAGRGFAVVADEVQRLAERSAAATKQIEALVKTIQNDTNEAVISMEQTTAEVVRGARLAQDAGVALEEIENVSSTLAELIQNISNAARQQASSAGHISNTMNVIQEITSQTSAGTNATAQSIGNLAEMASDLRDSVAGFKLPHELAASAPTGKVPAVADDEEDVFADLDDAVDLSMESAVEEDDFEDGELSFDADLELDDSAAVRDKRSEAIA